MRILSFRLCYNIPWKRLGVDAWSSEQTD